MDFPVSHILIVFRLDILSTQFTESVAAGTKTTVDLSDQIQQNLQAIQGFLGIDSTLVKKLDHCTSSNRNLGQSLETIAPTLDTLHTSVESLTATENDLVQDLENLGERLVEAQAHSNRPGLEKELSAQFAENTRLQLQLQALSSERDLLRRELDTETAETQNIRLSLTDMGTKLEVAESQNKQLENDKLVLQREVVLAEQRSREERNNLTTLSDQSKAQYEQQLQIIRREKEDIEKGTEQLVSQLSGVQDSLVGAMFGFSGLLTDIAKIEAKRMIDDQRRERETLVCNQLSARFLANSNRPGKQSSKSKSSMLPTPKLWLDWMPRPAKSTSTRKWRPIPASRKAIFERS